MVLVVLNLILLQRTLILILRLFDFKERSAEFSIGKPLLHQFLIPIEIIIDELVIRFIENVLFHLFVYRMEHLLGFLRVTSILAKYLQQLCLKRFGGIIRNRMRMRSLSL